MQLRYLLCLFVLSLPLYGFPPVNVAGKPLRWDWLIMLAIVLVFIGSAVRGTTRPKLYLSRPVAFLLVFHVFLIFSIFNEAVLESAHGLLEFSTTYVQYLLVGTFFLVVTHARFNRTDIRTVLRLYVLMAFAVATVGIIQFVLANALGVEWVYLELTSVKHGASRIGYERKFGVLRSPAVFAEPRHLGNFLVTPFNILVTTALIDRSLIFGDQKWVVLGLGVLGAGILVSLSASAFAVLGLSLAVLLPLLVGAWEVDLRRRWRELGLGGVVSLVLLALLPIDMNVIRLVLSRLMLSSYEVMNLFNLNIHMWGLPRYIRGGFVAILFAVRNPINGVGLNRVHEVVGMDRLLIITPPANLLIAIGPLGFLAFMLFLLTLAAHILTARRRLPADRSVDRAILTVGLVFLVTAVIKSFAASRFNFVSTWFWFDVSVAAMCYWHVRRDADVSEEDSGDIRSEPDPNPSPTTGP
jgi:hypothetical protein